MQFKDYYQTLGVARDATAEDLKKAFRRLARKYHDDDDILTGSLMEESWLTLEQLAAACMVEPAWLVRHLEAGLFPHAEGLAGTWRFSAACLLRARRMRRMRQLERDFDAVPELAALMAALRTRPAAEQRFCRLLSLAEAAADAAAGNCWR